MPQAVSDTPRHIPYHAGLFWSELALIACREDVHALPQDDNLWEILKIIALMGAAP